MKFFVIFSILIILLGFSIADAQYLGNIEFYHMPIIVESKQYSVLVQSTIDKFIDVSYDNQAGSLIFSISESTNLGDIISITMNNQTFLDLLSTDYVKTPDSMLVLINGIEQPYKIVEGDEIISWRFYVYPKSNEIEIIPSTPMFSTGKYSLGDIPNGPPRIYPPLKQNHIGIVSENIQCKENLVLTQKYDGSPACVKPETIPKLIERGWAKPDVQFLVLKEDQSWGYIKNLSILENNYVGITMSYPTNEAYHELYPDEYQSIVGNCDKQDGSASLSLLYLKEIDKEKNQITFTKEIKTFDGLQCEDAFWQEMTRWGYCGPPSPLIFDTENLVSSIDDAQKKTDLILDVPKYWPDGYSIQKITVEPDGEMVMLYASPKPVTNEMSGCEFAWDDEGIFLFYTKPSQNFDWDTKYVKYAEDPKKQLVTINDNPGYAENHWVGDRFGMPIPQQSQIVFYINADDKIIEIHSSLAADELIKIAESLFE